MGVVLWWWGFGVGWVRLRYGEGGGLEVSERDGDGGVECFLLGLLGCG